MVGGRAILAAVFSCLAQAPASIVVSMGDSTAAAFMVAFMVEDIPTAEWCVNIDQLIEEHSARSPPWCQHVQPPFSFFVPPRRPALQ